MLTSGFQNCQISELIFRGQNVYGSTRLDKRNTIVLDLLLYHEKQGSHWQKTIRLRRLLSVRPVAKIAAVSTPVLLTPWLGRMSANFRYIVSTLFLSALVLKAWVTGDGSSARKISNWWRSTRYCEPHPRWVVNGGRHLPRGTCQKASNTSDGHNFGNCRPIRPKLGRFMCDAMRCDDMWRMCLFISFLLY